jgi:hypothetical protein
MVYAVVAGARDETSNSSYKSNGNNRFRDRKTGPAVYGTSYKVYPLNTDRPESEKEKFIARVNKVSHKCSCMRFRKERGGQYAWIL